MPALSLVVPEGIDDPIRPSGGNVYDLRLADALRALGWSVAECPIGDLVAVLGVLPSDQMVLVDGLVASGCPDAVLGRPDGQSLGVLVHLPLGVGSVACREAEAAALAGADLVVATSRWTAEWLRDHYGLDHVAVAPPGVDPAPVTVPRPDGSRLLCVGAVTPGKGLDVLLAALSTLTELDWQLDWRLDWRLDCVGSLDVDPGFATEIGHGVGELGLDDRVWLHGPLTGVALAERYAAADLLVLPSRGETFGMVVVEALARGIPVVASDVGGVPEALGDGGGMLVPVGDLDAWAEALRRWLTEASLRDRLRAEAAVRRAELPGWERTACLVADALLGCVAGADR